jgi:4'-phosphopantetheinyl transferase EntD
MELAQQFAAAFGPQVRVVVADELPADFTLRPAEAASCGRMSDKRLREFALGRYCARTALAALGANDCGIPKGDSRAPVWPAGIVGSISHTRTIAAAVVARDSELAGVGMDLESSRALKPDLVPMICRPEERAWLSGLADPGPAAKIIFSAKESVYKCIWSTVRRYVDFQDVEITLDLDAGRYGAVAHSETLPAGLLQRLAGHCFTREGLLATTAHISA